MAVPPVPALAPLLVPALVPLRARALDPVRPPAPAQEQALRQVPGPDHLQGPVRVLVLLQVRGRVLVLGRVVARARVRAQGMAKDMAKDKAKEPVRALAKVMVRVMGEGTAVAMESEWGVYDL